MKTIILILVLGILITACSPKGDAVCAEACRDAGYTTGSCMELPVVPTPCEGRHNMTTLFTEENLCPRTQPKNIIGVHNTCCCR
jgi:hypothetical protein